MIRAPAALALLLATASALQSFSVQKRVRFGLRNNPTVAHSYLDSISSPSEEEPSSGDYLRSLGKESSVSGPSSSPVPSGTGFASYLDGLPRKSFDTRGTDKPVPEPVIEAIAAETLESVPEPDVESIVPPMESVQAELQTLVSIDPEPVASVEEEAATELVVEPVVVQIEEVATTAVSPETNTEPVVEPVVADVVATTAVSPETNTEPVVEPVVAQVEEEVGTFAVTPEAITESVVEPVVAQVEEEVGTFAVSPETISEPVVEPVVAQIEEGVATTPVATETNTEPIMEPVFAVVTAPRPAFIAKRERQPREPTGGAIVAVNEATVEFTAGVLGGVAGFAIAGPAGAIAVAAFTNYLSKQDDDMATVVQSFSKTALEVSNYLLKLESKYDVLYRTKIQLEDTLDKLKESDGVKGEAIDKVEKALASTVTRMAVISDEYDFWGETTSALGFVGELVEKTATTIQTINKDFKLLDRFWQLMLDVVATAKVAVLQTTNDANVQDMKSIVVEVVTPVAADEVEPVAVEVVAPVAVEDTTLVSIEVITPASVEEAKNDVAPTEVATELVIEEVKQEEFTITDASPTEEVKQAPFVVTKDADSGSFE